MKIYFIHPGENDGNSLTDNGIWQLNMLVNRLVIDHFRADRIYANGHDVSRQSAGILGKSLGIPIFHDERFVEVKKSVIEGNLTEADVENLEYINLFIDEVVKNGKDSVVALGDGIHRAVISRLTGMPLHSTRHFSLWPGSISVLQRQNIGSTGVWRMTTVNDTNHLRVP
ncbi:histidine phosphatase family protein [Candidatus Pacearchaeota archaeon]|nr:histidine phosphatase family protein [Candidatus Pacearchaeota archaeon]